MEPLNVVLYHYDPRTAQALAAGLSQHSLSVHLAHDREDLCPTLARRRPEVLVLNMETSPDDEVENLHREFPGLSIVCTHRLADDEMWAEALSRGASDICAPRQDEVVRSVMRQRVHLSAA